MSEPQNFLKALKDGQELLVPLLLLDGNYISYTSAPASPDSEGIEGLFKPSSDGLYYFADGLWRKVPAYTANWDDLDSNVRFLPIDKEVLLTKVEQLRLRKAIKIETATLTTAGLVTGSSSSSAYGAVLIGVNGLASVSRASEAYAGVVRVTNNATTLDAPVVTTKDYVDSQITAVGQLVFAPATADTIGGIRVGGDVSSCDAAGHIYINNANQLEQFGLVHIAPTTLTEHPNTDAYNDNQQSIPYVTTVSQVKNIANDIVSRTAIDRNEYIASTQELGFVKISAGQGLSVTSTGLLYANLASTSQNGVVKLYDDALGGDLPNTVPYMSQVKDYVINEGYITAALIPPATSTKLGGVMVLSGALQVNLSGVLSVRPASTALSGIVTLTATAPASENNTVFTAFKTKLLIDAKEVTVPDATDMKAGKVLVALGTQDLRDVTYTVPTVNYLIDQLGQVVYSDNFVEAVQKVVDTYPIPEPFPDGVVSKVLTFTRNTTFRDLDGDPTPGTVQFYQQPKIKGSNGELKTTYADDDILNYKQVKSLVQTAGGITWADFNELAGNVSILYPMFVLQDATIYGQLTVDNAATIQGTVDVMNQLTASSIISQSSVGTVGVYGTGSTLTLGVLGASAILLIRSVVQDGNRTNYLDVSAITKMENQLQLSEIKPIGSYIQLTGSIQGDGNSIMGNMGQISGTLLVANTVIAGTQDLQNNNVIAATGGVKASHIEITDNAEPSVLDNNRLYSYQHNLYWEGVPAVIKQTNWKATLYGTAVGDTWYAEVTGVLADGTLFRALRDASRIYGDAGKTQMVFINITVNRDCTRDELYPSLLEAMIQTNPGNPIVLSII